MSKVDDTRPAPAFVSLPEDAHFSLVQVAYFLRLMKQLTLPGTNASNYEAQLRPSALAWFISSLSTEIDTILDATNVPEAVTKTTRAKKGAGRKAKVRL